MASLNYTNENIPENREIRDIMAPMPIKCVGDISSHIKVVIEAGDISAHDEFEIVNNINFLTIANNLSLPTDSEHALSRGGDSSDNFSDDDCSTPYSVLSRGRVKYMNKIVFVSLKINSIRNKFDMFTDLIRGNVDILLISKTFPSSQFSIPGFSTPY